MSRAAAMLAMDAAAGERRIALQHCEACGAGQFPPREVCRVCLSDRLAWRVADAVGGELLARTLVCHSFEPSAEGPREVGLVRLGPGMVAVCFLAAGVPPGPVTVRAGWDGAGRAVLTAC